MDEAMAVARKIAELSPLSIMMAKEAVDAACETTLAQGIAFERRLFQSGFAFEDQKEGMAAFAEKRKPEFKGRLKIVLAGSRPLAHRLQGPRQWIAGAGGHPRGMAWMGAEVEIAPLSEPLCVLAADDDAANRLMLKSALQLFGATATVVGDGLQAVEAAGAAAVSIWCCSTSRCRGWAAATRFRAIRGAEQASGAAYAPAIAFSGYDAIEARSYERGFDFHLRKPVILSQLRENPAGGRRPRMAAAPAVRRAS